VSIYNFTAAKDEERSSGDIIGRWLSMRLNPRLLQVATFLIGLCFTGPVALSQINACKYLLVTDFSSDPYGIAGELRAQARTRGFTVISARTEVSQDDLFKACVMSGSWSVRGASGQVAIRVVDGVSNEVVGEAATGGTSWWGVSRTVRKAVEKIYSQLGYTGFKEDVYRNRMERVYPTRPKIAVTEEEIKKTEPHGQLEGIWSDPEDKYRLGVVPAPQGSGADYFGIILRSNSPIWQSGEIKAEFRSTASPDVFTSTYFMANKKPVGTTFTVDRSVVLRGAAATAGSTDLIFLRVWPKNEGEDKKTASAKSGASGTGFLLNRNGLIATNWHVVAGATNIRVTFPGWSESVTAEVVIRDVANDLAIIRATDLGKLANTCADFPYQLFSSSAVTLGQRISTIGYPLTTLLGSNPKFSEGVVSSKSGWQDDPRSLQISAQVQPGSSGSPLFDTEGNVVGVVVATLDAGKLYESAKILPQNVNWAIKSDYLLNLIGMLPGQSPARRNGTFSPEKAAQCVALVSAWQ
jgi:S1-C subfamily serine protease